MNKQRILIFIVVLILFWLVSMMDPDQNIGAAIKGDYSVGYVLPSALDDPINIGSLILAEGQYLFILHEGIDIPEHMIDRLFFVENIEGQYQVNYQHDYQAYQKIADVEDGAILAKIVFFEKNSSMDAGQEINQIYLIRHNAENKTLYFHSPVSEIEFFYVITSLE